MSRPARRVPLLALLACAVLDPAAAAAQQGGGVSLPPEVAAAVMDFWNDPRRERFQGPASIGRDSVVAGDIAVADGPLEVGGRIEGSVVVVNGDVVLRPGGSITGDLLVVGGEIRGLGEGAIGGEILRYPGRLHYRLEGERMVPVPAPPADTAIAPVEGEAPAREARREPFDFLMTTGNSYNRVEGLPITFGPRLRTSGSNPLRVHALAIYRTESGFTLARSGVGYYVRAEQYMGGRREWSAGGTVHSLVDPIEDWHLSDLENSLAAFLFHQDFRDHYEREGLSAFATLEPRRVPVALTAEVRWERHRFLPAGSPLTLFENAEPWRAQPLVAEGRLGSVRLQGSYDTRSELLDPSTGWYLRGVIEQGFHSDLTRPAAYPSLATEPPTSDLPPREFGRFTTGFVDLRRYNRLSPDVRFNVRGLLGGSLTGSGLPPQRQHAFGGEGSLPGYSLFSQDCGARDQQLRLHQDPHASDTRAYAYYGCDAFALVQAELRGQLDFRFRLDSAPWDDDGEVGFGWDIVPDWVLFANGGTGWAFDTRPDERFRMDAGAGLLIDRLGFFVAVPLDGTGRANVFVRLGPRF